MQQFIIDPTQRKGVIKPMHGICNGPVSYGTLSRLDAQFKEAGFPLIRLHDPDNPLGFAVDVPQIFTDFNADPEDENNYYFENTDQIIAAIKESCGAEIIYRLGPSIEHTPRKRNTHMPADFAKWANICIHIIRHYNCGWKDGFHYNIRFFEIWNEPDVGTDQWDGTLEQYNELYTVAAKAIKAEFPDVLVGGPACAYLTKKHFLVPFFEYLRAHNAPFDFFTWHRYSTNSNFSDYYHYSDIVQGYLNDYGYPNALSICDEWNYMDGDHQWTILSDDQKVEYKRDLFNMMRDMHGASFCTAMMTTFQCTDMYGAVYYDAQPQSWWCGVFDQFGVPTKAYYAFVAYDRLFRLGGEQISAEGGDGDTLFALAAEKDGELRILVTSHKGDGERSVDICMKHLLPGRKRCTVEVLDDAHNLERTRVEIFNGDEVTETLRLAKHEVVLLTVRPA